MSKHILLTEFEKELLKGIENKEKINYAFRRLLEFHIEYNIYFPACSPEIFINHNINWQITANKWYIYDRKCTFLKPFFE